MSLRPSNGEAREKRGLTMEPLHFLAALDLKERNVLVLGGNEEALSRAQNLLAHGARVRLVAPELQPGLEAWLAEHPAVTLARRQPIPADFDEIWLAVLADPDGLGVSPWAEEAERRQVFFCAIDRPERNSFAHVAVARAGVLQVGVGTNGAAPALAALLRRQLQEAFDREDFRRFVDRLVELRKRLPPKERGAQLRRAAAKLRWEGRFVIDDEPAEGAPESRDP